MSVRRLDCGDAGVRFRVRVADDGAGFAQGWSEGMGLHGMRERVGSLGGWLHFRARRGGGTILTATIPASPP